MLPKSRFVLLSLSAADHFVPRITRTSRVPYTPSPTAVATDFSKLKEHTTSIYTELCFICYKISPLDFFFLLLCRYCLLLYTSHERLMILNLACFKAFCSSVGRCRAERAVVDVVRSNLAARRRPDREATNQPTSLRLPALFLP